MSDIIEAGNQRLKDDAQKAATVEIEVRLPQDIIDKFNKMSKKELLNELYCLLLQAEIDKRDTKKAKNEATSMQTKLDKCESSCEQGRAMIEAVMERWYEYDV